METDIKYFPLRVLAIVVLAIILVCIPIWNVFYNHSGRKKGDIICAYNHKLTICKIWSGAYECRYVNSRGDIETITIREHEIDKCK